MYKRSFTILFMQHRAAISRVLAPLQTTAGQAGLTAPCVSIGGSQKMPNQRWTCKCVQEVSSGARLRWLISAPKRLHFHLCCMSIAWDFLPLCTR